MARLEGKAAVITGATSGMGRRTAERFVEEGANIVICGRRAELGRELESKLGRDHCVFIQADVCREAYVKKVIDACTSRFGRVDCLFNNAGSSIADDGIETIKVDDFDTTMASIVRSTMLGMKRVAPIMIAQRSVALSTTEVSQDTVPAIRLLWPMVLLRLL